MTPKLFAADSVWTYPEFERNILGVAEALRERGVNDGTRVLLKAGNSAGYLSTLLALMHLGASIVLVDHQERAEDTRVVCAQSGVKLCLVDDDAPMPDGTPRTPIYELLVAGAGIHPSESRVTLDTWRQRSDAIIMWSSGSTGQPKGVVKQGQRFLGNLERNAAHMGHRPDDVLLPLLPFNHQYGISMVLIAWLVRCSLVIAPYRRIDRALVMASQTGATVVDATPASYRSMLNIIRRKPAAAAHVRSVRMFCSGAAPLDPGLVEEYERAFGLPLLDSYGSTEAGNVAFATLDNPVGTGRAMDGLALRVVDETGAFLPAGSVGEIQVRTPDLMEGYLAADGTLRETPRGWFATGDFGYLDAGDNLFVAGRKLAVHRKGYTLHPEIIEHKAAAGGCRARIIPVPDERDGCQLVFFVEDEDQREAQYWRGRLAELLPDYERPNQVRVLDRFPLNRNGKPDKKQLESLAAQATAPDTAAGETPARATAAQDTAVQATAVQETGAPTA
ncbi:class I adenylate-forming enzyme family protein [Streptomyces oceani]|uniref:class I adenylate-forming enzyme family protein n=1 Tax=Streptomyces oceani TaxID=1075402 RepID=UPI00087298F1|nr:class I adenylate-forming enzyme family protein [Streptomyces oceani]